MTLAGIGCVAWGLPASAANWRVGANAGLTGTYTNNVNYGAGGDTTGDFVTSLSAGVNIRGEGARVQLAGSVAASWQLYSSESQNNSIAPSVNLNGHVEAIENFFFVDGTANVSTTFLSPFGPQPANIVTATSNRYISQNYSISPYVQGVFGASNIAYLLRFDNYWSVANSYGDFSNQVPSTYSNTVTARLNSASSPLGWTAEYIRNYYDNGLPGDSVGGQYTTQIARLIVPYRIDPQLQVSGRIGYERNDFPVLSDEDVVYGGGFQWSPTERTHVGGFWEHRYFGSSFSWQLSHRLPNAAISATFSRDVNNYPQLALAIPAGVTVAQFLDAAFTTRIPDPAERALAIEQFLIRTGLPPTLAAPVNFYGASLTLQNSKRISLVLIGVKNSVTFSVFDVDSTAITATGEALPPALQFGQDNTQTGVGVGYAHQVTAFTSLTANATYSRAKTDDTALTSTRSDNSNLAVTLSTQFTPQTRGSAGVTYSSFRPQGTSIGADSDALSIFASINHTF